MSRVAISLVGLATNTDVSPFVLNTDAALPDPLPDTLRRIPYVKARVGRCGGGGWPFWMDVDQSIVVPCNSTVELFVPSDQTWLKSPLGPERQITFAGAVTIFDAWLRVVQECVEADEPSTAILTDSRDNAGGVTSVFAVPPGARRATYYGSDTGNTVDAEWHAAIGNVIGDFVIADGAFGNRSAHNFNVVPGATHLVVTPTAGGGNLPVSITVAWEVVAP